jgi:error-prone DNA polymerase
MLPGYAELHCLSNFTFLRGASHPEELVQQAHAQGYTALALTDECSLAGTVRAHMQAKELGLKLIIGSELRLDDGLRLVLLACNLDGYGNLCELLTLARRRAAKGQYQLARADLEQLQDCLVLWLPGVDTYHDAAQREQEAQWVARHFVGRAWIAVELLRGPDDAQQLAQLARLGTALQLPLVAAGDVHMHVRERQPLQDLLTTIRHCIPTVSATCAACRAWYTSIRRPCSPKRW